MEVQCNEVVDKMEESIGVDGIVEMGATIAGQPFGLLDHMAKCGDPERCSIDASFVSILLTDHPGAGQVRSE